MDILKEIQFNAKDRRFNDESWKDSESFKKIKLMYLDYQTFVLSFVQSLDIPIHKKKKILFWLKFYTDAISPSNFPFTNPEVIRETINSSGENLFRGFLNLLNDFKKNNIIFPLLTNPDKFFVGENIAATDGNVIFENKIFQLIHYVSLEEKTYENPLLIIPALVNKFYICDLSAENSFVKWNLNLGREVFMVSWINPSHKEHDLGFNDYLYDGIKEAIIQVNKFNSCRKNNFDGIKYQDVNVFSFCLGATYLLSLLAEVFAEEKSLPIKSISLITTPYDFSYLEWAQFFMNKFSVSSLENQLKFLHKNSKFYGVIPGYVITRMFCSLRANDLIWPGFVERYLLGRDLPAIDFLFWNNDSPSVTIRTFVEYIERFLLENAFIDDPEKNKKHSSWMKIIQSGIQKINIPAFIFGTERDHIVPWHSSYKLYLKLKNAKFVLGGAGHIVGFINPPHLNKYHFYENNSLNESPEVWLKNAEKFNGSWWISWNEWMKNYDGGKNNNKILLNESEIIEKAPGSFVKKKHSFI